jgi:hypothetical protein
MAKCEIVNTLSNGGGVFDGCWFSCTQKTQTEVVTDLIDGLKEHSIAVTLCKKSINKTTGEE